ncbi:MAG: FapA family protein, partial [Defluviitaleaceae bacterium]|nr:FapA family protein [Defluviitaleaceae bacterium]
SSMGTMTEVTVGRNNDLAEDLEKVTAEIQEANMQFSKLNEAYEALTKLKKVEEMDNKQKTQLLQLLQQRNAQRDRAVELESEKDAIEEIMKKIRGRIIAEKVIFAGVKVTIGPAYKQLNDDITISILTNDSGMIKARPFM